MNADFGTLLLGFFQNATVAFSSRELANALLHSQIDLATLEFDDPFYQWDLVQGHFGGPSIFHADWRNGQLALTDYEG